MSNINELIIEDIEVGSGDECPSGATVEVHYKGTLMDGTVFDSSYDRGESINFPLGNLIQGWQEGIPGMKGRREAQAHHPLRKGLRRARCPRRDPCKVGSRLRDRTARRQLTPTLIRTTHGASDTLDRDAQF